MKNKKQRKTHSRAVVSLLLVLCIVFSSFPTYAVSAGIEHFIGLDDIEAEEGTRLNLLENVSAYGADNESLEVMVTSVTSQNDSGFVYDSSNFLTVGSAGSEYVVEYLATSSVDENVAYTGLRRVTSIGAQEEVLSEPEIPVMEEVVPETEDFSDGETLPESEGIPEEEKPLDEGEIPEAETIPEGEGIPEAENSPETEETTQSENTEFDESVPFTISDLEGMGYSVQMDTAKIPIENFQLQCLYDKAGEVPCSDLHFAEGTNKIDGGKIKDHVPKFVRNRKNKLHAYVKAHVGNVSVYYMGILRIDDGDGKAKEYVYYTTDTQITNKTVYAVLKENEKITLTYSHDADYEIEYQMFEKGRHDIEQGPEGWSYGEVFGEDRAISVKKGQDVSVTVKIPRGYQAEISVVRKGETPEHIEKLGQMMVYEFTSDKKHLQLRPDSPKRMIYETSFDLKNIQSDVVITLEYEKVQQIHFNAYMWTQTPFAKNRIKIEGNNPTESNANLITDGHSFTWEWDGITTGDGPNGTGNGGMTSHTWELDQLEINDEALIIPMISLNDVGKTITEHMTLSTGTEVTLSVTSLGGTNARDGKRHYKLEITNCYEDVTISGGNMVGHKHQEYVIRELFGVKDAGFFGKAGPENSPKIWRDMQPDTLIAKIGYNGDNYWDDPFRFKREIGYYKPDISFTTKDGIVLQKNNKINYDEDKDGKPYIEYLIRKDNDTGNESVKGEYDVVSWDNWKVSSDGYFYFRGSDEVKEYVGSNYLEQEWKPENAYKGVILININAHPIRIGLDYLNGADETEQKAPKEEDIVNLPKTQYGGRDGYNLVTNPRLLISNLKPVDLKNEFVFDHWEVMATDRGRTEDTEWGYLTGEVKKDKEGKPYVARPGEGYYLDVPMLDQLENCFYMKADPGSGHTNGNPINDKPYKGAQTHAILTVRAVWKKYESKPTIPYTVKYVTAEVNNGNIVEGSEKIIEERTHTVNEGAMLVTDLYQDGTKTPSASIQAVLEGENAAKQDYTNNGDIRWVVYEPKTTKMIPSVDMQNNVATIYLIKGNTKVNVEKAWTSREHTEAEVTVQLERRKTDTDSWEKVGEVEVLNESKKWEHQFDVDTYYELPSNEAGLSKTWKYRVVEVDAKGTAIEDGQNITINNHNYQVGYRFDTEKQAWVITNTRLLDLTISKVVEGKNGDRTKEFIFAIKAADSAGNLLNGDYSYIGGVKTGFESQSQNPDNGTLKFLNGKAQIKLKHGQQIQIKNLPANAVITVTEQSAEGYKISYTVNGETKNEGTLTLIKDSSVDVVNEKSDIAATGITDSMGGIGAGLGIAVIAVLSFGGLALLRLKKGRKR